MLFVFVAHLSYYKLCHFNLQNCVPLLLLLTLLTSFSKAKLFKMSMNYFKHVFIFWKSGTWRIFLHPYEHHWLYWYNIYCNVILNNWIFEIRTIIEGIIIWPGAIFDHISCCKRRTFRCHVPNITVQSVLKLKFRFLSWNIANHKNITLEKVKFINLLDLLFLSDLFCYELSVQILEIEMGKWSFKLYTSAADYRL